MLVDVGDALLGDPMYDLVSCMRMRSTPHAAPRSMQHTTYTVQQPRAPIAPQRLRSNALSGDWPARQVALHISALHCDVALLREFLQEYGGPWSHCGTFEYAAPPKSC